MNTEFFERALLWIVLLPLLGAVLNGVIGCFSKDVSRRLVAGVGVGTVLVAFLLSLLVFARLVMYASPEGPGRLEFELYEWFSLSFGALDVPVRIAFVADALSGVMLLVVTGIGLLIHVYSQEYMADDPGFVRFFTYLNLFMASMLILILGSSLPVMFIGWEGVGLCSYLLIGFWYTTPEYAAAGKKAFIVNRIGDFGVLLGMFILFTATTSFEFDDINRAASSLGRPLVLFREPVGAIATIACLFLFLGCAGKSAQIPLYVWLPDAMAGPTPVSALIHAATMVTAGVYLCCRLSAVFIMSPTVMAVIAIVGSMTALLAASIALVQNHMKRILAYSTVSQLGFMFAAVGTGAFTAGFFHVFTHAFFKACLFLGAGAVMHAVHAHGDADVRRLGGLRAKLPTVHWTFLVSCLAIAGVPMFSGFFSKDEILLGALTSQGYFAAAGVPLQEALTQDAMGAYPWPAWIGWIQLGLLSVTPWLVFIVLTFAAAMTAYYMFRLYFLTFSGEYRSVGQSDDAEDRGHGYDPHPHRPHLPIQTALIVLGVGAVVAGYLGLPHALHLPNYWGDWLHHALASSSAVAHDAAAGHGDAGHGGSSPWIAMAAGTLAMAVGIGVAFVRFSGGRSVPGFGKLTGLPRVLSDKWYVDELYDATVVRCSRTLAVVFANFDRYAVDGLLTKATSFGSTTLGWLLTRVQNGVVYVYAGVMVAGTAVVIWWFMYPHPQLKGTPEGAEVEWVAATGLGYQYAWDTDHDGSEDACSGSRCSARFGPEDYRGIVLVTRGAPRAGEDEHDLEYGEPYVLPREMLGDWSPAPAAAEGAATQHWPRLYTAHYVRMEGNAPRLLFRGVSSELDQREVSIPATELPGIEGLDSATVRLVQDGVFVEVGDHEVTEVVGGRVVPGGVVFAVGGRARVGQTDVIVEPAVAVKSGGAPIRIGGRVPTAHGVDGMGPGEELQAGPFRVRAGVAVEGAVRVTNSFGNESEEIVRATIEPGDELPPRQARLVIPGGGASR